MSNVSTKNSQLSDSEIMWLMVIGVVLLGSGAAGSFWGSVVDWLLDHQILVPASAALFGLPGASGAGLDAARVAIGVALLFAVTVLPISWFIRRRNSIAKLQKQGKEAKR